MANPTDQFAITLYPPLAGGTSSGANAINAHGVAVGWSEVPGGEKHAVIWHGTQPTDLGTLSGTGSSQATGINKNGQVVGWSYDLTGLPIPTAVLWEPGAGANGGTKITNLGDPLPPSNGAGWAGSTASDIDDAGNIVGSTGSAFNVRAWIRHPDGTFVGLDALGGPDAGASASAISNSGHVVGWSATNGGKTSWLNASLWNANVAVVDLDIPDSILSEANDVNDAGVSVGVKYAGTPPMRRGFLSASNHALSLVPTLGGSHNTALGINLNGDVVGSSETPGGGWHAFIWSNADQVVYDLNRAEFGNWTLVTATGINASGSVAGNAERNGVTRAFVLGPNRVPSFSIPRSEPVWILTPGVLIDAGGSQLVHGHSIVIGPGPLPYSLVAGLRDLPVVISGAQVESRHSER